MKGSNMTYTVISYSLTGNNSLLAEKIAERLKADRLTVLEPKARSMGKIMLDMLWGRVPSVTIDGPQVRADRLSQSTVIFVGPIWMGKIASPFRGCFQLLKDKIGAYAFVSLSGGADGANSNTGLDRELETALGKKAQMMLDLHIADLLPSEPKPTRKITSSFRLGVEKAEALAERVASVLADTQKGL
jgi:hypothetical protein